MPGQNLTIADGQVAAGTAVQITAPPGTDARRVNAAFSNVGGLDETLTLLLSRSGGTARRIKRVVLAADEQMEVCGLALNGTDSLLAVTTNAASVDYVVSIAADTAPQTFAVYDDNGRQKTAPYSLDQLVDALG